ncbi:hypothetical protein K493DRAFT_319054 [Basidiobolus meristosporus CBS 931.73]|uniref:G-protein coupled receptors family 2 profile 2 domain-containing protein n=1 Tax=Basidiobolus meristosporus CBS 931.73 TaxID=1314790 RepID=A0A1Y1XT98_9FUNG|nr:hypothetical protein K493DRAFT_319054 [Basidiobolus meristosporus CBS 931.73]|eukprot:ORX88989.1 hypothetical protein K493DRAFT_319054 [Basidiobolus meristosporus CBS 931.73]
MGFFKTTSTQLSICTVVPFFENVAKLSAVFITGCIAYNLRRVFIKKMSVPPKLVRGYIPLSILFAVIVSIPGLVYSLDRDICWLKDKSNIWPMIYWWITSEVWMLIVLTYCLVIVIVVFRIIHQGNREIKRLLRRPDGSDGQPPVVRQRSRQLNQAAVRIIMYPIVPILSFTPSLVTFTIQMIQLVGHHMHSARYQEIIQNCTLAADFISSWTGIFAGIAFMWDPVVTTVIMEIRVKYGWADGPEANNQKPEIQIDESGTFRISSTMPIM